MRNLKALGLAPVAMLAMSAFVASAAQAQGNATFTPAGGLASVITGTQEGTHTFKVGSRSFTCTTVHFEGTIPGNTQTFELTPQYEGCKTEPVLGVSFPITVTHNECKFHYEGQPTNPAGVFNAAAKIVCPAGKRIELHVYSNAAHTSTICTLTIEPQTLGGTEVFTNQVGSNPHDITLVTNATFTATIHGTTCGEKSPTNATTTAEEFALTYSGNSTFSAKQGVNPVSLTVSHP